MLGACGKDRRANRLHGNRATSVVRATATGAHESATAAAKLSANAVELQRPVDRFKLSPGFGPFPGFHVLNRHQEGVTMKTEALLKAPSLAGEFPLKFANGYRITALGFWCLSCRAAIPLAEVRGHLGSLLESVVDITAAACCPCGETNRYRIRLHDDASCSYLKGGAWVKESNRNHAKLNLARRIGMQLFFFWIRWKCYWLARSLRIIRRDFREKHGLHHDS